MFLNSGFQFLHIIGETPGWGETGRERDQETIGTLREQQADVDECRESNNRTDRLTPDSGSKAGRGPGTRHIAWGRAEANRHRQEQTTTWTQTTALGGG